MIAFEVSDLVLTASATLGLGTESTLDLLDVAAAEAALAEASAAARGDDPAAAAAALLHALVLRRPFRRGNDRVALMAALQLLAMHGWRASLDPPAAVTSIIAGITAGQVDAAGTRGWLQPRLQRESETRQWEAPMRSLLPARRRRARRASTSAAGMFERPATSGGRVTLQELFTDQARRVVVLAQEEARMLNHNYIGTEHILLGLTREGDGVAARALESAGISLDAVRKQVEQIIGTGEKPPSGHIPFTPRAKKVIQLSQREAIHLGSGHVATEHVLLGLIREGKGVGAQVLTRLGASHDRIREQVVRRTARSAGSGETEGNDGGNQQSA